MSSERKKIKIAFIGGGSLSWAPTIVRDITFKEGMNQADIEFSLLDIDLEAAEKIKALFDTSFAAWGVDWATVSPTNDSREALQGADFVIITISTGRLPAMRHDLEVPERYGIYHTVGDTAGPGGWARSLRNIPVFQDYAEQIGELCPEAIVLNYTNPMGTLTKVLADELGNERVVGLCHGIFENYEILQCVFGVEERDIQMRYGGLNHFFWILDFKIGGRDGYELLEGRLQGRDFAELVKETHTDSMGWSSDKWLAGELYRNHGFLPYFGDRHTCEFFCCYMTRPDLMERFKLVRTSIEEREQNYARSASKVEKLTRGENDADTGTFSKTPSRETAADIIKAAAFNEPFRDVVNMVNVGQIISLPIGSVVETMGYIDSSGAAPITVGALPDSVAAILNPHAEVQIATVEAGLEGDLEAALLALVADPVCAHLTASDIRKMGMELLEANRQYLPQFFD